MSDRSYRTGPNHKRNGREKPLFPSTRKEAKELTDVQLARLLDYLASMEMPSRSNMLAEASVRIMAMHDARLQAQAQPHELAAQGTRCLARHHDDKGLWVCTAARGHDRDHTAHDGGGGVLRTWPQ